MTPMNGARLPTLRREVITGALWPLLTGTGMGAGYVRTHMTFGGPGR